MVMKVASGPAEVEVDRLTWEEIGRAAKQTENEIDGSLLVLGRLASAALRSQRYDVSRPAAPGDSPLRRAEEVAEKIQAALARLAVYIDALAQRSSETASSTTLHILQRHRDICAEYTQEFRKTKAHLNNARENAELVTSVREEINSYGRGDAHSYLLSESNRIESAHKMTEHVINVAYSAQGHIQQQGGMLSATGRRVQSLGDRFPAISKIMAKVRLKRYRDKMVIAAVVLILVLVLYLFVRK